MKYKDGEISTFDEADTYIFLDVECSEQCETKLRLNKAMNVSVSMLFAPHLLFKGFFMGIRTIMYLYTFCWGFSLYLSLPSLVGLR